MANALTNNGKDHTHALFNGEKGVSKIAQGYKHEREAARNSESTCLSQNASNACRVTYYFETKRLYCETKQLYFATGIVKLNSCILKLNSCILKQDSCILQLVF